MTTVNRALAGTAIMLGLAIAGSDSRPSYAEGPDRLPQMTALIEDAVYIASEMATCQPSYLLVVPQKLRQAVQTALRGAGLEDQQIADLLGRLEAIKPLIGDDRPIAEALLFCDSRPRDEKDRAARFFQLAERITEAAATPAGRDDAVIRDVMDKTLPLLRLEKICLRLVIGPFPKSKGIDPDSRLAKELARFDISAAMREHLEHLFDKETYFETIKTVGDLRAVCTEHANAVDKVYTETGRFTGALDALIALQPTR